MISEALLGREEYMNSEKFQFTKYDWSKENKVSTVITKINHIRKENEALQQTNNINFCYVENNNLLAFYKWNDSKTNQLLIVVSLDDFGMQQGTVQVPLSQMNIDHNQAFEVQDLVTNNRYSWRGEWNFVELHPTLPFHIFKIIK